MFGRIVREQRIKLLLMDGLDVSLRNLAIRRLDLLVLETPEVVLEVRDIAGRGEEHHDVLVDVLQTAVDIVRELSDQLGPHVVLHPEES
jgi:hypothetical protein